MTNPHLINAAVADASPDHPQSLRTTDERVQQTPPIQRISELRPKLFYEGWGISENPFGVTPDPRYLYQSKTHAEAISSLVIGVECGVGFQALIAPPGMGKTTVLMDVLEQFKEVACTGFLCQPQGNSSDLLRSLIAELEGEAHESDLVEMQEVINNLLLREKRAGKLTIVIIDEAQSLTTSVLETVRLLSNFETSTDKLLHIILAGQPQLAERLASPEAAQLSQRISVLTTLVSFDLEDTAKYVDHRLKVAGYRRKPLFSPAALNLIWEHSRGTPRTINKLCFNAMLVARSAEQKQIDSEIIQEVVSDLDLERLCRKVEASCGAKTEATTPDIKRAILDLERLSSKIKASFGAKTEAAVTLTPDIKDAIPEPASQAGPKEFVSCSAEPEATVCNIKKNIRMSGVPDTAAETETKTIDVQHPTPARSLEADKTVAGKSLHAEVPPETTAEPEPAREVIPDPLPRLDGISNPALKSNIKHLEPDSAFRGDAVPRTRSEPGSLADSKLDLAENSLPSLGYEPDSHVEPASQAGKSLALVTPIAASQSVTWKIGQALWSNAKSGADTRYEMDAASGIDLDAGSVTKTIEEKPEPSNIESAPAAVDQSQIVPVEGRLFGDVGGSRLTRSREVSVWIRAKWQRRRSAIYLGVAALLSLLVLLWHPPSNRAPGEPQQSTFDQLMLTLGVADPVPRTISRGNPEARVWVDVRTGLYYCPGGEMYGKTRGGNFTTQRDAQENRFKTANHKACP
jgi:general secretion pathway protein A